MLRHRAAALAEAGVHPDRLAQLTDRQIAEVYAHPRDDNGRLVAPRIATAPRTLNEALMHWEAACVALNVKPEDMKKGVERIRATYGQEQGTVGS